MMLRQVAAPAALAVSVASAKANARITIEAEDALIQDFIRAALAYAERWCDRAFLAQEWERTLDAFPAGPIALGFGPVASVSSIVYLDPAGGGTLTLDPAGYALDEVRERVIAADGWPAARTVANAVRVRFVAGSTPPADVAQAIRLIVGHWFRHREAATFGAEAHELPLGARALLAPYRRMIV